MSKVIEVIHTVCPISGQEVINRFWDEDGYMDNNCPDCVQVYFPSEYYIGSREEYGYKAGSHKMCEIRFRNKTGVSTLIDADTIKNVSTKSDTDIPKYREIICRLMDFSARY